MFTIQRYPKWFVLACVNGAEITQPWIIFFSYPFKKSENELAFRLDVENGRVPGDDVAVLRLDVIHQRYEVGQLDVDVSRRARHDHVARLQQFGIVQATGNGWQK